MMERKKEREGGEEVELIMALKLQWDRSSIFVLVRKSSTD